MNPRVAIPVSGVAIALLTWLFATAMSPDRMVSAEFVAMDGGMALVALMVGILWPEPAPAAPPLTEEKLAALLDGRYLRSGQPLPEHNHAGVYADVGHVHHEVHDHPTNGADPEGPRTGRPDYNVAVVAPAGGPRVI